MKLTQTKPIKLISIGGSSIAAVLGLSRFTTPYQKWLLLTGRKSSEDSPSLRRGVIAERFISEYAVSEGLVSIYESQKYISFGAANGTIDAIGDYQGERVIIEFKSSAYIKAADDVPNDYRLQCVWYIGLAKMAGIDVNRAVLITCDGWFNLSHYLIDFDCQLFEMMDIRAGEWYERHIINDIEPQKDIEALSQAPEPLPDYPTRDELVEEVIKANQIKYQIKELSKHLEEIEFKIKEAIGEHEGIIVGGNPITWKPQTRTSIDVNLLKKEMPEVVKKYEVIKHFRVLKY